MPKLTENVLIGGRVRLAGEEISNKEAEGVRADAFEVETSKPVKATRRHAD